jgi:protein subunit release factor B
VSERPTAAELRETYRLPADDETLLEECDLSWYRASGPGGQHRNTSLTAVRLLHRPSGILVIGRRERSRKRNLDDALARLRARLEDLLTPPKKRKRTRRTRASVERRLSEKRRRSERKRDRGRVED